MSHISFSELKEWKNCPWKHKLNYLEKIKQFKGNEYTAFGSALHSVCETTVLNNDKDSFDWTTYDKNEHFETEFLNNLKELKEKSPDIVLRPELIEPMRAQGKHITEFILPALKKDFGNFKLVAAEESLYELINSEADKKFKGFIDLVIYTPKDEKYHIIDWKTCGWGWDTRTKTDKMTTYQLTLYKHYWCKKHDKEYKDVSTHFALLKRTAKKNIVEIFKVSNGSKKIDNALKLLNKAMYNIEKKNYIKNRLACHGYGVCEYYKSSHCA